MFAPFQTSISFTETHELFSPINKNPLTNDPNVSAPGSFPAVWAEGEVLGGAVTNGTNCQNCFLPATLRNKSAPSGEVLIV